MADLTIAVELRVVPETGVVRMDRVVAAIDCGQIVNPDSVRTVRAFVPVSVEDESL